ncbi:MAG: long-chain fatty acid--CoA ligase [Desulfovibrionaceae bacterium]|nr:long-chain fatty acid--CoA ligase [Desulfovibrionaceae bacterium]
MTSTIHHPWEKFYSTTILESPAPSWNQSLGKMLDEAAQNYPERKAISYGDSSLTYAELEAKVLQISANLYHYKFHQKARIGIMLPNLPENIMAFWGVIKAAGVIVMLNPLYKEKEIIHNLNDSQAEYLILSDQQWPIVSKLRSKLPVHTYFIVKTQDTLNSQIFEDKDVHPWSDLFTLEEAYAADQNLEGETPLLLQYTGGTTGTSKGVILTHHNLGTNALQMNQFFALKPQDGHIFLDILPFFHVYGLTLGLIESVSLAATMIPLPKFDPRETLKAIEKFHPSIFPSAPAMFISLLQQKELSKYDLKSIKICMSGSAPLPQEIFKKFHEITGAAIVEGYGLTEASPVTHFTPLGTEGTRERSIGIPLPGTEARIVDMEAGALTLEPGKKGELVVKGPQVMQGYLNNPDETASALRNKWLYTGDIAVMDEDGFFYIVDRKKDMAIVGGYNVFPREVDEVLMEHPQILEAVCVGLNDPLRGEVLKAFIVPKPGEHLTKPEIVAFCRKKLASYKVPRQVEFRESLPKTIVGKILRRHLREEEERKLSLELNI